MAEHPFDIIVGLDVGTTKICAVVGEVTEEGSIEIIAVGTNPSKGLKKGVVVNIEHTVDSITKAVEEAQLMAGCEIESVIIGISGNHIKGFNSHGVIAVKGDEITESDVERVIDAAQAVAIPMDRDVIDVLPQEYIVDDQTGIVDPVGMMGVRLEARVHIITGAMSAVQNLVKCANEANLDVENIVLQPLASADAVLKDEERDLGVALIDFGGGTTDLAVLVDGAVRHTAVLGLGGNNLTNDISIGLRTPMDAAEKIKKLHGTCMVSMVDKDEVIEVPSVGGRAPRLLRKQILAEILEPRVEEMFTLLDKELKRKELKDIIPSGIVITGGSSKLNGICEMADQIFQLPTRIGYPRNVYGLQDVIDNPEYATAVGLVIHGFKQRSKGYKSLSKRGFGMLDKIQEVFRSWFKTGK